MDGNRKITQENSKKEVIYQEVNGEKVPAVEAATGLETHKIQVFEMVGN